MAQDTRKDPRAKVLTMTVRYKSATLDEFIEHHSHDISRGGMFIKTPSPFPAGTLLKFEVKIAADQKVIQGVGRVVWKRDGADGSDARPGGMGVKFIKIDDASRKVIDSLVDARGDESSAYEAGGGEPVPRPAASAAKPAATPSQEPGKQPFARKGTMIGLGAIAAQAQSAAAKPASVPPTGAQNQFFPSSQAEAEADMPPPEDRTVMKQAAELLQDALREAGGTMEDLGTPAPKAEYKPASVPPASVPRPASVKPAVDAGPTTQRSEPPSAQPAPRSDPKPEVVKPRPASARPAAARAAEPASRRPSVPSQAPPTGGSGGRVVVLVLAIAAVAGAVFFLTRPKPEPDVAPTPTALPEVKPPEPVPSAPVAPADTASAAPAASESAAPPASASAAPSAAPVVPEAKPVVVPPTPVPKPAAVTKPAPKPAPVAPSQPVEKPAPAEKPAAAPVEKPAPSEPPAEKPAPAPKPAKPKPAEPSGDNPY
ncbi:MAG TPA: TIGR02266 family protein [Polyangiaceae bacterium]|jgi:uncharacterized protein (TIGR02266 family)